MTDYAHAQKGLKNKNKNCTMHMLKMCIQTTSQYCFVMTIKQCKRQKFKIESPKFGKPKSEK